MKRIVAILFLAALLVATWLAWPSSVEPAHAPHGSADGPATGVAPANGDAENASKSLAREAASPALPAVATARAALWTVRGTCVGSNGAGLADVSVVLAPSSPEGGFVRSQSVVGQQAVPKKRSKP